MYPTKVLSESLYVMTNEKSLTPPRITTGLQKNGARQRRAPGFLVTNESNGNVEFLVDTEV